MSGLRELKRQERTEQMLLAARELFISNGYHATRMDEIAERANVAPATVYNYFETKPNILTALAVRHLRASLPERRALLRSLPDDPVASIHAFEDLLATQALRTLTRECWRTILGAQFREPGGTADRTSARFQGLIQRQYVQMLRHFQDAGRLDPDVDAVQLASLATAIGTYHFGRLVSDETMTLDELKSAVAAHLDIVFRGLVSKKPMSARKRK